MKTYSLLKMYKWRIGRWKFYALPNDKFTSYYYHPCILHVIRILTQIKIKIKTLIVYMKSINMCVHIIRLICHENEMRNSKNAPQIPKLRQSTKLYFPSDVLLLLLSYEESAALGFEINLHYVICNIRNLLHTGF